MARALREIVILKGLPASGKSTYAKELVDNSSYKRINKDDLRAMIDNSRWSKKNEKFIVDMRDTILAFAMLAGHNIVVDDTNLEQRHEEAIRAAVDMHNNNLLTTSLEPLPKYEVRVVFVDTPLGVCLERNRERTKRLKRAGIVNLVTDKVIKGMYNKYMADSQIIGADEIVEPLEQPKAKVVYKAPKNKPECVIVDIDGTLAHHNDKRSPYDWSKVSQDTVDETVAGLVRVLAQRDPNDEDYLRIVIFSGRDVVCRAETEAWLRKHNIYFDELHMRPSDRVDENNNQVADTIIKREMFDKYVKNNYHVRFVLDDRDQVVDMWRNDIGLKVLQVAEGAF